LFFLPIGESDLELVRSWRNQDEIRNNMYTNHIISPQEHRAWYNKISKDPAVRYWIFSDDGIRKVGLVYLYDLDSKNRRAFWGLYVGDLGMKGGGLGSKVEFAILDHVFLNMDLNKLCCEAFVFNEPALRLYKKFGFEEEGYLKQHIFRDERYYDVVRLAMLREEWIGKHRERIKQAMGRTEEEIARKRIYVEENKDW